MYDRKEKNYKLFCYFNNRRLVDGGRTVISIKTLEQYCGVANYTIQHLVSMRRLITDSNLEKVIEILTDEFGFNLEDELSKEDQGNRFSWELFN